MQSVSAAEHLIAAAPSTVENVMQHRVAGKINLHAVLIKAVPMQAGKPPARRHNAA